jgi:hypothetical protein
MRNNYFVKVAIPIALMAWFACSHAEWREGIDYASRTIRLDNGAVAKITVSNYSRTTMHGNWSKVELYINGKREAFSHEIDNERVSINYTIRKGGVYHLENYCTNRRADAVSCTITVQTQIPEANPPRKAE